MSVKETRKQEQHLLYIYIKFDINILWNHQNCFVVAQFSRYLWIALSQEFTFSTKQIWKVIVFEMKLKTYVSTKWHPHELAQNLQSSKTDPHGFEWFQSKLQMLFSSLCTCKILFYSICIESDHWLAPFFLLSLHEDLEKPRAWSDLLVNFDLWKCSCVILANQNKY